MNSNSMQFFFKKKFTYSCVSWRPLVAFLMEFELHELEFHANFYFYLYLFIYLLLLLYIFLKSLIVPYSIFYKSSFTLKLDFEKIEL